MRMREKGHSYSEIGEKFGLTKKQIAEFFIRYYEKQRKIAARIAIKKKGRPTKDSVVTKEKNLPNYATSWLGKMLGSSNCRWKMN